MEVEWIQKNLKAVKAACLVRNTDGTGEAFPGDLYTLDHKPQRKTENTERETESKKLSKARQVHLARSEHERMPRLIFHAAPRKEEEK